MTWRIARPRLRAVRGVTRLVAGIALAVGTGSHAEAAPAQGAATAPSAAKTAAVASVDRHRAELVSLSDQVWAFAETAPSPGCRPLSSLPTAAAGP
jgi:hypothetical protein